jgi:hypothetical protein
MDCSTISQRPVPEMTLGRLTQITRRIVRTVSFATVSGASKLGAKSLGKQRRKCDIECDCSDPRVGLDLSASWRCAPRLPHAARSPQRSRRTLAPYASARARTARLHRAPLQKLLRARLRCGSPPTPRGSRTAELLGEGRAGVVVAAARREPDEVEWAFVGDVRFGVELAVPYLAK